MAAVCCCFSLLCLRTTSSPVPPATNNMHTNPPATEPAITPVMLESSSLDSDELLAFAVEVEAVEDEEVVTVVTVYKVVKNYVIIGRLIERINVFLKDREKDEVGSW